MPISSYLQLSEINVALERIDGRQLANEIQCEIQFVQRFAPFKVFNFLDIILREIHVLQLLQFIQVFYWKPQLELDHVPLRLISTLVNRYLFICELQGRLPTSSL